MDQYEQHDHDGHKPPKGRRFELWFYERQGARYYLRVTPLGLILFVLPIVFSVAAICLLFIYNNNKIDHINPDITITTPKLAETPPQPLIKPPPPPPKLPKVNVTPPPNTGNVSFTPSPHENTNE